MTETDRREGTQQILSRLDRFERQLDEMRQAIVHMARTEERVAVLLEQNGLLFKKIDETSARVSALEKENATQSQSLSFFERAAWILAGGAASVLTWFVTE